MNHKLFSIPVVLIMVFTLVVGSPEAQAGGRHRNRNCQQNGSSGAYDPGFNGLTRGKPWGEGPLVGHFGNHQNTNCPCQSGMSQSHHGLFTTIPGIQSN